MDKIEKIRAEITRLKGQLIRGACAAQIEMETNCKDEAYNEVLAFLDALSEEPDKDLEEAADNFAHGYDNGTCDGIAQECFIAGAEWQKEQDEKEQADLFTIVALDAAQRAKEQLMKEAVEGVIKYYPDFGGILIAEAQVGSPFHYGDKVKVIVIKED